MGKTIEKYKGIFITIILALAIFSTILGVVQALGMFDALDVLYTSHNSITDNNKISDNLAIALGLLPVAIALFILPMFIKDKKKKTIIQIIALAIVIGACVYFMFFLNNSHTIREYYGDPYNYYSSIVNAESWANLQLVVAAQRQIYAPIFVVAILGIIIVAINDRKSKGQKITEN